MTVGQLGSDTTPRWLAGILLATLSTACQPGENAIPESATGPAVDAAGFTAPTPATIAANRGAAQRMPGNDSDRQNATRGLLAMPDGLHIKGEDGQTLWDASAYRFLDSAAEKDSIHPGLLRQARLNNIHGLFEVLPGIYQLRGFDLANMTIIDGESGWIVVDPLTSRETATAAIVFARQHLPSRPVSAVIYTHSHADHFAGVLGVVSPADVSAKNIPVIAPEGFLEEALSENVAAGIAMARRATLMYGRALPRSPRGHVDSGLGKSPAIGRLGILEPNIVITRTGEEHTIDGVRFVFQNAPGSEAPAELTFYLPDRKAFCGAEIVSHTMHNLYTLRGAKVRDALAWSGYIDEALGLFGDAQVIFNSHHWPIWGNDEVIAYLEDQRDLYKYVHDQTVGLINAGMTPREIAEELELPKALQARFANHGYYGTLRHNAKAVYQNYLGWYDGNPANLDPLPPEVAARRYVEAMGGEAAVLEKAQAAFDEGDYRWVAELVNHVVFTEPANSDARSLLAASYDQLGYQAESAPWRDVYLSAAYELRHGVTPFPSMLESGADMLRHMPLSNLFTSMATRIDASKAEDKEYQIAFHFTDLGETYLLHLKNSVLHHRRISEIGEPDATMHVTHATYLGLVTGQVGFVRALAGDEMSVTGSKRKLVAFLGLLEEPDGNFAIVTP